MAPDGGGVFIEVEPARMESPHVLPLAYNYSVATF